MKRKILFAIILVLIVALFAACDVEDNPSNKNDGEKDSHVHTEVIDAAVAPTCTETGLAEGKHCSVCEEVIVKQETVAANGHTFAQWTQTLAPTCTEKGSEQRICEVCNYVDTREIDALGHDHSTDWTVDLEPTCTEKGSKSHHCSRCSDKADVTEIAANGHAYSAWVVTLAPACTEKGIERRDCDNCDHYETRDIAEAGHSFGAWIETLAPNCTEKGSERRDCDNCDHYETREIDALGHDHSTDWTVDLEPTCTEVGSKSHHCSRCFDKADVTEIAANGHTFGQWTQTLAPTCIEKGSERRDCDNCDHYETREIDALGHDHSAGWTVDLEPTCTEVGSKSHHCSRCSDKADVTEIAANGHAYSAWVVTLAPACTEKGIERRDCDNCDHYETREIDALGHDHSADWTVDLEPTCTEKGSKSRHCSRCSDKADVTEIDALGHTPGAAATCTTNQKCTVCNEELAAVLGHNYIETIVTVANCKNAGTKKYACDKCSATYTEAYEQPSYTATEIHDMYAASICEILTYKKNGDELALGSGFVYSSDGKIITNYHVIEDAYSIKVTLNGKTYNVTYVLAYDKDIDLAVLQIEATNLASVQICVESHKVGAEVYAFGSSRGLTATFSRGIITYSNRELNGVIYVQHDAAISSGNSGGPLINQYGEVIGINTLTVKDSQNLNFAIDASELSNLTFGTKLTVSELYEKENDVFEKMKNFIIENGTYTYSSSSSGSYYRVTLGYYYSSNYQYKYTRYAYYYISSGKITIDFSSSAGNYVYFSMDDITGTYQWYYIDDNGYAMYGTLYASTFTPNTLLGYSYNNISGTSLRATIRELASVMMIASISYIDTDFASIGVTAEDLGFYYF